MDQTPPRRAAHPRHPREHLTERTGSGRRGQLTWEPIPIPASYVHPQKEQDGLGLESHEYHIKIGQVSCDIQIVSDRVIHCSVNESLGTAEGQLPITVSGWGSGDGPGFWVQKSLSASLFGNSGQQSRALYP